MDSAQPKAPSAPKAKGAARDAGAATGSLRKQPIKVPPILLEGDEPPPPAVSGPGQRYALGPEPPPDDAAAAGAPGQLPEAYGTEKLLLTARDPHWLYAHWDLTTEQLRHYNRLSADGHLVLRVFIDRPGREPLVETHVHPESRNWFLHVGRGGTKFVAALGYYAKANGRWTNLSVSAPTLTPPETVSADTSVQFATIPVDVPFQTLLAVVKTLVGENVPLADAILQLRAEGYEQLPNSVQLAQFPTGRWTPAQERALAELIALDEERRVWIGSLEITELVRRKLGEEISSVTAAQFSPAEAAPASVSSPFGGVERRKGFWFNVNAELVIYGATEADAKVQIGGRDIKLRQDGSFSFRFALPDGQFQLPVVAVSADQTDSRAAELQFSRETEYRGEVGLHPQDPNLKPAQAENVG